MQNFEQLGRELERRGKTEQIKQLAESEDGAKLAKRQKRRRRSAAQSAQLHAEHSGGKASCGKCAPDDGKLGAQRSKREVKRP